MDTNGPYEGRADMREVTRAEFDAYRRATPNGDWNISTPVGTEGPNRYFIPEPLIERVYAGTSTQEDRRILSMILGSACAPSENRRPG